MVDDRGGTTTYTFDTLDRQVSTSYHDGSRKVFAFDSADDVVTYTDENEVFFQHDGHNGHNDWRGRVGAKGI